LFSRRSSRRLSTLSAGALFAVLFFVTATNGPERMFAQGPSVQLIAGRNVNMVSGTEWPNGDPFLQRQNEPSIAASTRNPMHLLGGSNDYRTIDLPGLPGAAETGDAWLGLYKSFDGGDRWQSTLLPGYPQDTSPAGMTSPLKGYQAGADPVVRAGTNGLLYFSGIVFDRANPATPGAPVKSRVFVARFIDNNNKEAGDPIAYLGTSVIASNSGQTGAFIDKPWIAVDIPRGGAQTCVVRTPAIPPIPPATIGTPATVQRIAAGNIYAAYSIISGTGASIQSSIMFASSSDCGATWTRPVAISDPADKVNQGATIAIDPSTGAVHVAWRQFGLSATAPDAVTITTAPAGGRSFRRARKVRQFMAHHSLEQIERWLTHERNEGRDDRDDKGKGKNDKDKDDRDNHGRGGGGAKRPAIVDAAQLDSFDQVTAEDRFRTNAYPTMAVDNQGRVYLAWTERGFAGLNNSQTMGDARVVIATSRDGVNWNDPQMVEDPIAPAGSSAPTLPGHQLMPSLAFAGGKLTLAFYDLRETVSQRFGEWVNDVPGQTRTTIDIRATQADPSDAPAFAPSVQVSQYIIGSRRGSSAIEQLQFNAPNLPLFQLGTVPFIGDYIDLVPSPAFLVDSRGRWRYNVAPSTSTVFHLAWTDNRDVRKPADGDWTRYTPPSFSGSPVTCDPGFTASRNQNVYTSKLTQGLLAGSPGNAKTLSPTLPRGFVVFAQNTTDLTKTFRFTIQSQPAGGRASFNQLASTGLLLQVDATVPARSTVSRTVYMTSTNPKASVPVDISEVSGAGGTPLTGGLKGTVVLNPDIANPDIANPDIANPDIANPDIANPDIANAEVYNPDIANPDIANPDIANPDIANPDIANPDIANPDIANPDIANPDIANPDIANPDIANPDIANPDIANPDIANGAITDVTWTITNTGNTTATFDVDLFFKNQNVPGGIKTQLILYRVYKTPESTAAAGCEPKFNTQKVLVANILNPVFKAPGSANTPDPANSSEKNATMWIEPGGTARITLRIVDKNVNDNVTFDPVNDVKPVVTSESYNTPDIANGTPPATPPPTTEPPSTSVPYLAFASQPSGAVAGAPMPTFTVEYLLSAGHPGGAGVPVTLALVSNPAGGMLVGTTTVMTDGFGHATFSGVAISKPGNGYTIAASSAAANAIPVISVAINTTPPPPPCNPLVVTNSGDAETCGSLRAAITYANSHEGLDTIAFNIPGATAAAPAVIAVTSSLPTIVEAVNIDGASQPGYSVATGPSVEVSGASLLEAGFGFDIQDANTTIRGLAITGFPEAGVWAYQNLSGIVIEHNTIGTNAAGAPGKGNGEGVQLRYISNSFVQDNVIAGNTRSGVLIEGGAGNTVHRNEIGMVAGSTLPLGNTGSGITIYYAASNTAIDDNMIAANGAWGIDLQSGAEQVTGTIIRHNTIGLDANGNALPNHAGGVHLGHAPGTVIDGGNVISGNYGTVAAVSVGGPGILVEGNVMPIPTIQGNSIGTTADGLEARPNKYEGIVLAGPALVGGSSPGEGNLISGNGFAGTLSGAGVVLAAGSDGTVIAGNIIGPNAAGAALGNGYSGITVVSDVANVTIGGMAAGEGNVIAGNPSNGIAIYALGGTPASNITIQGNRIGVNQFDVATGNGGWGVSVGDGTAITIGGTVAGAGNVITANTAGGVVVGSAASQASILSNRIDGNGGLGIDLGGDGVTGNDALDADTGPNGFQNAPVLSGANTTGVSFTFDGALLSTVRLQFFAIGTAQMLGETVVMTGGDGHYGPAVFTFTGPALALGASIIATATDVDGNTSEFSGSSMVAGYVGEITSVSPQPAAAGFGQMITVLGSGLPVDGGFGVKEGQVVVAQGASQFPAHLVWGGSSTKWTLRLPVSGLAAGNATIRLKNAAGTTTTNEFTFTISATPGAPYIQNVFNATDPTGFTTTPISELVAGNWITVEAVGVDSGAYDATYVFTPASGIVKTNTGYAASDSSTGGVAHTVQVPADLDVSSWVDVQVYANVNSVAGTLSNAVRIGSELTAGGSGGSPFGPFSCPAGSVATNLLVGYNTGDFLSAMTTVGLTCTNVTTLATTFVGVTDPPAGIFPSGISTTTLNCSASQPITGLSGTVDWNPWVSSIGATCGSGPGATTLPAFGPGNGTPYSLNCPAGQVALGVTGRRGWNVDQIGLVCGPPPAPEPVPASLMSVGSFR